VTTPASDADLSRSPARLDVREIEVAIEETRRELDRTLDALQGRFSIRRRFESTLRPLRAQGRELADRGSELARNATEAVRRRPLPYVVGVVTVVAIFAARAAARRTRIF
jgi:hypothetical protein